jgi:O-antigen ligase
MIRQEIEKRLSTIIACGSLVVTLLVTDRISVDPANVGKMVALATTAGFCLAILISLKTEIFQHFKLSAILLLGFVFVALISIVISINPWEKGFYGTYARNTGFLTYLSLSILFLSATQMVRNESYLKVIRVLLFAGVFNLVYSLFAMRGFDIFTWQNPYGKVLGTFGNPNFISSFLAIFLITLFIILISPNAPLWVRGCSGMLIVASLYVIKATGSQQGLIVAAGGIAVAIFFFLRAKFKNQIVSLFYSIAVSIVGLISILGMLQLGPLAGLLYKDSVSYRGEYWQAGINMALANPIFGIGLDSYGTYYRPFRSESATIKPGVDVVTDSSHNVFIDILSSTGFIGFFFYATLILLVVFESIKFIRRNRSFDPIFVILFSTFIAYNAQSIISINQIGLAIWGWILAGLLLGYTRRVNLGIVESKISTISDLLRTKKTIQTKELSAGISLGIIAGGVAFFILAIPSFYADASLRKAIKSNSIDDYVKVANQFPVDSARINYIASRITIDGINEQAVTLVRMGLQKFPIDYGLMNSQYLISAQDSEEHKAIGKRLHLADPFNPAYFKFR